MKILSNKSFFLGFLALICFSAAISAGEKAIVPGSAASKARSQEIQTELEGRERAKKLKGTMGVTPKNIDTFLKTVRYQGGKGTFESGINDRIRQFTCDPWLVKTKFTSTSAKIRFVSGADSKMNIVFSPNSQKLFVSGAVKQAAFAIPSLKKTGLADSVIAMNTFSKRKFSVDTKKGIQVSRDKDKGNVVIETLSEVKHRINMKQHIPENGSIHDVAFCADNKYIVVDIAYVQGNLYHKLIFLDATTYGLALSIDKITHYTTENYGDTFVYVSQGKIVKINIKAKSAAALECTDAVAALAISANGSCVVVGYDNGKIEFRDRDSLEVAKTVITDSPVVKLAFSPNNKYLVVANKDEYDRMQLTLLESSAGDSWQEALLYCALNNTTSQQERESLLNTHIQSAQCRRAKRICTLY